MFVFDVAEQRLGFGFASTDFEFCRVEYLGVSDATLKRCKALVFFAQRDVYRFLPIDARFA